MSAPDPSLPSWRRALVVGLGASGRAAAALLRGLGVEVHAYDARQPTSPPAGVRVFVEPQHIPDAAFEGVELVVLSPGVPPSGPRARAAACAPEAEITGELDLALRVLQQRELLPRLALITGTNGKSTITALLGHLLEAAGRSVFTGGNLGIPLSELALRVIEGERAPHFAVLECSSYQLETLSAVPTEVGILCNLSPDHLARYDDLEHYARTKTAVFSGLGLRGPQRPGLALLDGEDAWTPRLRPEAMPAVQVVEVLGDDGPRIDGDALEPYPGLRFDRESLRAAGRHNAKNALFALRAALHLGVEPEALGEGLASFDGLPHRMQFVREVGEIAYYDDSKATNVASVLAGLSGFARPFVLIAGGQLKGDPLEPLIELVAREGRGLVALGEGAPQLLAAADERIPTAHAHDMAHALQLARGMAEPGQAIVLSPAGASWDMYDNFAARGRHFAELIEAL